LKTLKRQALETAHALADATSAAASAASFARRIVGWRVSSSMRTDVVLDALDQAIYDRCDAEVGDLIHHSDSQYLSMRYTERLADAGIEPSVGSRGHAYDNAVAESVIGLFKTEVIRLRGPRRHLDAVEVATLEWVDLVQPSTAA
jgi:putative transposase